MMDHSTTDHMNTAIRDRWIAALTSREYQQMHFSLHTTWPYLNMFSAAGVLCELHRLETRTDYWRGPDGNGDFYYLDHPYYIPQEVRDWAGMPERWPIDLNALDQQGLSFSAIAAEIARVL